jgi:hypothetical protein
VSTAAPGTEAKPAIAGYRTLSDEEIGLINAFKAIECKLLGLLRDLEADQEIECDKRWVNIGRTHLEQAFMAINRSIARPVPMTEAQAAALVGD